jgi:hypothetical protein
MKFFVVLFIFGNVVASAVQASPTQNPKNETIVQDQEDISLPKLDGKHNELVKKFQIQNYNLLSDDYLRSSNFAIGLLSRNKWNVLSASKSLKKLLLWRSSNHADKLGEAEIDEELLKFFPYKLEGVMKDGCPVLVIEAGKWLLADFIETREFVRDALKAFDQYTIQMLEKARLATKLMSPKCDQALYVANGTGLTTKHFAEANSISAIIRYATVLEAYYPNLFKKVVVTNANVHYAALLDIFLPYAGETSKQLVSFTEEETEQALKFLSQYMDIEQLKVF